MQHRATPQAHGRHRRTVPLHSHRAPSDNRFGERGRHAVLTVTLVAGVGVAGVSAATAGAAPSHPKVPADHTRAAALPADTQPAAAEGTPAARTPGASTGEHVDAVAAVPVAVRGMSVRRSGALLRAQQKPRPVPVAPAEASAAAVGQWVNPLPEAAVTSCFGQRWGRLHAGVDLAAPDGTRIMSVGAGVIVRAGVESGYGNAVLVDHGAGYLTHYGHMSILAVTAGQRVAAGEQLGNEGSTGHSTGPHLHFEVHQGGYHNPIEPTAWLHARGVTILGCPTPP